MENIISEVSKSGCKDLIMNELAGAGICHGTTIEDLYDT
jgi:hypothetical protein